MATDLVFTIESIGRNQATPRQYYFARGNAPSWDTDAVWVESCWTGFPSEIASAVSFFDGSFTIGGLTIDLFAQAQTQQGASVASILYDQHRVSIATLSAEISNTTQQDITLDVPTLANAAVCIGRETIRLGAHTGSNVYDPSVRGILGTSADKHGVGIQDYTQVFSADVGPLLRWRRLVLYRVNLATASSYSDLDQLWSGVVFGISSPTPNLIRVEADSMIAVLEKATILNKILRYGAPAQTRNPSMARLSFDPSIGTNADMLLSVDGECVVHRPTRITTPTGALYDLSPELIETGLNTDSRLQSIPDQPRELWQVIWCSKPKTFPDTHSALPPSSNLLTLLLQLITTTQHGTNGTYDLGVRELGLGVPQSFVDTTTIEQIRDTFGDLLEQPRLVLNLEGKPVQVLELLRRKLIPYGIAIIDKGGKISVATLDDNDQDAPSLGQVEILGPSSRPTRPTPSQVRRFDLTIDNATAEFADVPGHGPVVDRFSNIERRRISPFGERSTISMDMRSVEDAGRVQAILAPFLQRFNEAIPDVSIAVPRTRADLEIGDLVKVTHDKIYQATSGTRGVTDQLMLVVERVLELNTNVLRLRLLDVGALYGLRGYIAPAATVSSSAGSAISVYENFDDSAMGFQSGELSGSPYDLSELVVGDVLQHCDSAGVLLQTLTVLSTAGAGTINVTSTPSPAPADGDVLRLASYDTALAASRLRYAWLADTNGTLGAAADPGKEYTY